MEWDKLKGFFNLELMICWASWFFLLETVPCLVGCLAAYLACITRCRYHPANCERQKCLLTLPNLWGKNYLKLRTTALYQREETQLLGVHLAEPHWGRLLFMCILTILVAYTYKHINKLVYVHRFYIYMMCVYNTQHFFQLFFQKLLKIFIGKTITSQPGNVLLWSNEVCALCVCLNWLSSAHSVLIFIESGFIDNRFHYLQTKFTNVTSKSSSVRRYTIRKNKLSDMMVICGDF